MSGYQPRSLQMSDSPQGCVDEIGEKATSLLRGPWVVSKPEELSETCFGYSSFPMPGDHFLYFELLEELGRGSFAHVYLARQESLANRLVVLKISRIATDEPQKLARLQHTNVVPVYSIHDAGQFHALCMPYLGRVTLAHVISHYTKASTSRPESGRRFLGTLFPTLSPGRSLPGSECAISPEIPGETLEKLGRYSSVDAALWLVSQLAAGLAHAHSRGILHRDLKPANVLLASDGMPMILDFNISSESSRPAENCQIGGTLPYMSPEHLRAFAGENRVVDERSDLYSLGVILYELLTGELPYRSPSAVKESELIEAMTNQRAELPIAPSRKNPAVSPAVDAIALKLLEPRLENRYRRAEDVREDITRQLANRPLVFARNRSPWERLAKWRRRKPRTTTAMLVASAAILFLLLPVGLIAYEQAKLAARASAVQKFEAINDYHIAIDDLQLASVQLGSRTDSAAWDRGLVLAKAVLSRYELDTAANWEERPGIRRLDPPQQSELKARFGEVLILMTRAEAQKGNYAPAALETAGRWNELACTLFDDSERPGVIARHRAELKARLTGQPLPPLPNPNPALARDADLYFDGRDLAAAGRLRQGLDYLARYCQRHPTHFQAWYARGLGHQWFNQHTEAAEAFAVCVALRPDFPQAYANRGLARIQLLRFADAEADFSTALELKPNWTLALINRGLAFKGTRAFRAAEADFTRALANADAPTQVFFLRSQVRLAAGDKTGAKADRVEGMTRTPNDATSWITRGVWRMHDEPKAAIADFDAALQLNPHSHDALLNKATVLADIMHREAEAIPVFDQLLEHFPDDLNSRGGRGVYLARLGRAAEAHRDAKACLEQDRSAFRTFQMAGIYALLSRNDPSGKEKAEALRLLGKAVRGGFSNTSIWEKDADLNPIRRDPGFLELDAMIHKLERCVR